MQAEQRPYVAPERLESRTELWQPFTVHGPDGSNREPLEVEADDRYVVVEDIADGRIVLEVSRWPQLDHDGRLVFEGDPFEIYQSFDSAQETVDAAREEFSGETDVAMTAPNRTLRIGDVFAARGLDDGGDSLADAERLWDVSLAARNAAKAALYGAVASTVEPEYERQMAISGPAPEEPPEAPGVYDVRQQAAPPPASPIDTGPVRRRPPEGETLV